MTIDARIEMPSERIKELTKPLLDKYELVMPELIKARSRINAANRAIDDYKKGMDWTVPGIFSIHMKLFESEDMRGYVSAKAFFNMACESDVVSISHTDLEHLKYLQTVDPYSSLAWLKKQDDNREIERDEFKARALAHAEFYKRDVELRASLAKEKSGKTNEIRSKEIASCHDVPEETVAPWAWIAIAIMIVGAVLAISN